MENYTKTIKKYYPATMFSGEIILSDAYDTYEEAKEHTTPVFPDVEWVEYNEYGFVVANSYGVACPWMY